MSDPSQPKERPEAPAEGPTKAFRLKFDDWMTELMKKDLGLDAPEASSGTPPAEPDPPAAPPGSAPEGGGTGGSSG